MKNAKLMASMLVLILFIPAFAYVEKAAEIEYDYSSPTSIVKAAKEMIVKGDFKEMLNITEMNEKQKTLKTIENLKTDYVLKKQIIEDAKRIERFEVLKEEVFTSSKGDLAVVYTKWQVKKQDPKKLPNVKLVQDPNNKTTPYSLVYVDYLLKKFDGKWKIISQRNR